MLQVLNAESEPPKKKLYEWKISLIDELGLAFSYLVQQVVMAGQFVWLSQTWFSVKLQQGQNNIEQYNLDNV